jgi:hypothetical protein
MTPSRLWNLYSPRVGDGIYNWRASRGGQMAEGRSQSTSCIAAISFYSSYSSNHGLLLASLPVESLQSIHALGGFPVANKGSIVAITVDPVVLLNWTPPWGFTFTLQAYGGTQPLTVIVIWSPILTTTRPCGVTNGSFGVTVTE